MSSPKDKEELVLNPITGKLDIVKTFNPDRIITAQRNAAGQKFMTWDVASESFIEDGPRIITDEEGNVVTT